MQGRIAETAKNVLKGAGVGLMVGLVASERAGQHYYHQRWDCFPPHPGTSSCTERAYPFANYTYANPQFYRSTPLSMRDYGYIVIGFMIVFAICGALYGLFSRLPENPVNDDQGYETDDDVSVNQEQATIVETDNSGENQPPLTVSLEELENSHERRLREAGYQGPIPENFKDPVNRSIMVNPVILITDDHTTSQSFDEETVLGLIERDDYLCPLTRKPFKNYILNRDLKNIIDKWVGDTIADMEKKPFNELPREVTQKKLLEAQGLFKKRVPVKPRADNERCLYLSKTI